MSTPDPFAVVLARLEVKLDQLLADTGDHEQRLRRLEERRWPLPVLSAVFSGVAVLTAIFPLVLK